jgi:molybdopterin synthase sulfur carrier subunit
MRISLCVRPLAHLPAVLDHGVGVMKDPMPINLMTPAEVREQGWQAECRDQDGHLTRTHAPFESDEDIAWLVREATEHGDTVTIWPVKP